jgi:hypothetical protein
MNEAGKSWRCWDPLPLANLDVNALEIIQALEEEFRRSQRVREAGDRRDRAILIHASSAPRWAIEDSLSELASIPTQSSGRPLLLSIGASTPR